MSFFRIRERRSWLRHEAIIFVVDDDGAMRKFLCWLLSKAGFRHLAFESAQAFLDADVFDSPGCLLLDIRMAGMSGLQLQKRLNALECPLPVILITGHGDVPMAVEAMKEGAFDFFEKPFENDRLLTRVKSAVQLSLEMSAQRRRRGRLDERMASLTPREREVHDVLILGETNKVIAQKMGISPRTVEIHRARIMKKLQAYSVSDLIRWSRS